MGDNSCNIRANSNTDSNELTNQNIGDATKRFHAEFLSPDEFDLEGLNKVFETIPPEFWTLTDDTRSPLLQEINPTNLKDCEKTYETTNSVSSKNDDVNLRIPDVSLLTSDCTPPEQAVRNLKRALKNKRSLETKSLNKRSKKV